MLKRQHIIKLRLNLLTFNLPLSFRKIFSLPKQCQQNTRKSQARKKSI